MYENKSQLQRSFSHIRKRNKRKTINIYYEETEKKWTCGNYGSKVYWWLSTVKEIYVGNVHNLITGRICEKERIYSILAYMEASLILCIYTSQSCHRPLSKAYGYNMRLEKQKTRTNFIKYTCVWDASTWPFKI